MSKEAIKFSKAKVIDLFCGIGGLSYGLKKAGLTVVAGIDVDKKCQFAYEENNALFINKSISDVTESYLKKLYKDSEVKILVGCAPCQTFSKHTLKNKNRTKDKKWRLLNDFAKKIAEVRPEIISMENVPGIVKSDVFDDFLKVLQKYSYNIYYRIVYCPDYGVPQNRSRLVLLASSLGVIELIPKTHIPSKYKTVREVISKLKKIKAGEVAVSDVLHRSAGLSEKNIKRIEQSIPGGSWEDWDQELLVDCHKKNTGKTYSSVYGRMKWDKPSPTITTQFFSFGTGRFGHPEQNRAISLREGALLQTFPMKYKFLGKDEKNYIKIIGRHIGNAVPVRLGEVIGKSIVSHLEVFYGK